MSTPAVCVSAASPTPFWRKERGNSYIVTSPRSEYATPFVGRELHADIGTPLCVHGRIDGEPLVFFRTEVTLARACQRDAA